MDISRVKYNLNHIVRLIDKCHNLDAQYILTGCIIRKRDSGFYYQAELKDINANSLVIADLNNIYE